MIRLIVKGSDPLKAEAKAAEMGVTMAVIRDSQRNNESWGVAPEAEEAQIQRWFVEDLNNGPPFPVGSLLWYGFAKGGDEEESEKRSMKLGSEINR